jgi:hypothetical protein
MIAEALLPVSGLLALLTASPPLVRLPLDKMLRARQVEVTASRTDAGGPRDVLGPSPEGMCRFTEQPAHLTLVLPKPVAVGGARVRFSHHGGQFLWQIACADTAADLDAKTGSYRAVLAERAAANERTEEATWPAVRARAWRLTCREDGGDPVLHLRWLALLCSEDDYLSLLTDGAKLTALRLTRGGQPVGNALEVPGNRPVPVGVEGVAQDGPTFDLTGAARLVTSNAQVLVTLDGTVLLPRRPGPCSLHAEIGAHASPIVQATVAEAPDLILLCIERTPRYPKYHPSYENFTFDEGFARHEASFAVGLERGETTATRRWPKPGDEVTYHAVALNQGNVPIENAHAAWTVDGREAASGPVPPLAPGATARVSFKLPWTTERRLLGCELVVPGDASPANNRLARATDALEFTFLIEEGYRVRFAARTERVKKPSTPFLVEFIHRHMEWFNRSFEGKGCRARVAVGHLAIVPDGAPELLDDLLACFDGRFPDRFRTQDTDWRLGGSGYYRPDDDLDYGFLHEMGHQLGLVDLYRLNLEREHNKVTGTLYRWDQDLMHGCSPVISEFTARALDAWHGHRRGYYGQYLYDLPATVAIRLADKEGKPLTRCAVAVYQKIMVPGQGEQVCPTPKFRGATDADGLYVLPNVPIDPERAKPVLTGNVLRPNPWGHVACVAFNGLFLIEAAAPGGKLYAWLPITEANLAYWRGERDRAVLPLTAAPLK